MATAVVPKHLLDISHLKEVFQVLRKYHFTSTHYYQFGLSLGLLENTLKAIESDHRGDTARCLLECLSAWLRKADNVESEGDPSWYTLIAALRSIGEPAVAEGIAGEKHVTCMDAVDDREKHPACVIFARHQSQFLQALLPSLVILLHKEGITKEVLPATGQTGDLLTAVQEAVCVNNENLEKFAAILQLFPATVSVGNAILKDYREKFNDNSSTEEGSGGELIHIPRSLTPEFQTMRNKFASTLQNVNKALKVSVNDLKSYCQLGFPHLKPQLATCKTILDVLQIISERCTLTNISLLEGVVDHFKIKKAKEVIQLYKKSIEEFCQTISLRLSLDEKFSSPTLLKCQTATFVVNKEVENATLSDVDDVVNHAFEQLACDVNVVVVKKANSFTITCSFPLILSESLIKTALHNLDVLVQKKGLLHLTIGYSTVYSSTTCDEAKMISDSKEAHVMSSIESSSEWVTAVYTSRGTLEQMIVSQTVQHAMDKEEIGQLLKDREKSELESEQLLQSSLQTKAGLEETLVESKKERELLCVQLKEKEEQNQQLQENNQSLESQVIELRAQLQAEREKNKEKFSAMKDTTNHYEFLHLPHGKYKYKSTRTAKGNTGRVDWFSDGVRLISPSVQQCREVIAILNHQTIELEFSSADSVLLLLPAVLQRETIKTLEIRDTSFTLQCILSLFYLLTINKSLETLELKQSAITDEILDCLCLSLQHNHTLTSLDLSNNNGVTSNSSRSLSDLLLTNSTLTELNLCGTSLSSDGVIVLLNSLTDNKTLKRLRLDGKHKTTCHQHPIPQNNRLFFW